MNPKPMMNAECGMMNEEHSFLRLRGKAGMGPVLAVLAARPARDLLANKET
jgi:hypothetical protein